jgi:signal transduction histidine kinase
VLQTVLATAPTTTAVELDAAILQAAVTLGLAGYAAFLHRRYRKPHFAWFSVTWLLYTLRLGAIIAFLLTADRVWLYWHQVVTGWTALALLRAAVVFARGVPLRRAYLLLVLFPPWSFVAIYVLDNFLSASLPSVLFLSVVTAGSGAVFFRHWRAMRGPGAGFLAGTLFLWALHHLDYPFLRARGAWSPWGYYLDIVFLLGTAVGLTLLVLDELRLGFGALTSLAGVASEPAHAGELDALLKRALTLPATRGAALFARHGEAVAFVGGVGACAAWGEHPPAAAMQELAALSIETGRPIGNAVVRRRGAAGERTPFASATALPIPRATGGTSALVLVGDARNPFAALDDRFLVALGQQIGAAMDRTLLTRRLEARTLELSRLSARMVRQHEEERRRLSLELHDETAQVFSAVKLQLGLLRERAAPDTADALARAESLVDDGMRSIRNVTGRLRPTVLDDLGLVPALRSLAASFQEQFGIEVRLTVAEEAPAVGRDAELALFRALQEALSNSARHAAARRVTVQLAMDGDWLRLEIRDDGRGLAKGLDLDQAEREGHLGLAGMRERLSALGGALVVTGGEAGGVELQVRVPITGPMVDLGTGDPVSIAAGSGPA